MDSYIKLYSLYELYLHFIGCLINIGESSLTIEKFEISKYKSNYANEFKNKFENDTDWRIFYEFFPNKLDGQVNIEREARHIDVHENVIVENGVFKGWYIEKCFISEVDFNNNRRLLTILLTKVSESLDIYPDDKFYDEFIEL